VRIVLASASPARLATLRAAGISPEVMVSEVDEDLLTQRAGSPTPTELVALLAGAKAATVAKRLTAESHAGSDEPTGRAQDTVVIGCDSMLEIDGRALGKPASAEEASTRWRQMRGRTGVLRTGHALSRLAGPDPAPPLIEVSSTLVRFAEVTDSEIEAYVGTGEPLHVAGAFTLDGLGGWFITGIEGDHHGVVGISLPLLRTMLTRLGLSVVDLWDTRH
jgi:septum formation protein